VPKYDNKTILIYGLLHFGRLEIQKYIVAKDLRKGLTFFKYLNRTNLNTHVPYTPLSRGYLILNFIDNDHHHMIPSVIKSRKTSYLTSI